MTFERANTDWDNVNGPVVNGKVYPLWGQFVMKKAEWIGGDLIEHDSIILRDMETKIKDIKLEPNGKESAMFCIYGEDFNFKADVKHIGIGGKPSIADGLRICGPCGLEATIAKRSTQ